MIVDVPLDQLAAMTFGHESLDDMSTEVVNQVAILYVALIKTILLICFQIR